MKVNGSKDIKKTKFKNRNKNKNKNELNNLNNNNLNDNNIADSNIHNRILSEDLAKDLYNEFGSNEQIVILNDKNKKNNKDNNKIKYNETIINEAKKISKSKRKKLEQLQQKKIKLTKRNQIYQSLQEKQLSNDALKLMKSSARLGHKETIREKLKNTLLKKNLGLDVSNMEMAELEKEVNINENENDFNILIKENEKNNEIKKEIVLNEENTQELNENNQNEQNKSEETTSSEQNKKNMQKLMELRQKNEEKRMARDTNQIKEEEKTKVTNTTIDYILNDINNNENETKDKYIPKPIILKSTFELQKDSKIKNNYNSEEFRLKNYIVPVKRKDEISLARMELPVCGSEQEIMEAIIENSIVILCGETGSGKTTQVPQFLYESGFGDLNGKYPGLIGVTQPRRVAAISTAKRVAEELNTNDEIGYQIRYDIENINNKTKIKFMTDGILLKEVQEDFLLKKYSIILLDEAHERNINTDILIGLLSRIIPLREKISNEEIQNYNLLTPEEQLVEKRPLTPLKLVIMSATLRIDDFINNKNLFPIKIPPVIKIEARQFPVTIHFNRETELINYVDEAYKKTCQIHQRLPDGGILVFLTGQREIQQLCRKLNKRFNKNNKNNKNNNKYDLLYKLNKTYDKERQKNEIKGLDDDEEDGDLHDMDTYENEEIEDNDNENDYENENISSQYVHVLPLYALLSNENQMKIFEPVPENHRLIVVATNVAETSLTIPNIKYVVDCGRMKEKTYNVLNGIEQFEIKWISKASANQRAGRAGRTGPGHCYRLYSPAVFKNQFLNFSEPQIVRHPVEDLVLQMKKMGIDHLNHFPFPTPPNKESLIRAIDILEGLGAIEKIIINDMKTEKITELGKLLSEFPIAPRFAKMLLLAKEYSTIHSCQTIPSNTTNNNNNNNNIKVNDNIIAYTIAIVAGLSGTQSPFISINDSNDILNENEMNKTNMDLTQEDIEKDNERQEIKRRHSQWIHPTSDLLIILRAAGAYAYTIDKKLFCKENFLHEKIMNQMLKLRYQLSKICNKVFNKINNNLIIKYNINVSLKMNPPTHDEEMILQQIIINSFIDQLAKHIPSGIIKNGTKIERNAAYVSCNPMIIEPLYIDSQSNIFTKESSKLPEYIVYQYINKTNKNYMKNITIVESKWLLSIMSNCSPDLKRILQSWTANKKKRNYKKSK